MPKIMYSLTSGVKKYLDCDPMIVGNGTKSGIRIATTNPMEIGADRVVDAVGAYSVSYTHLDVYKRQGYGFSSSVCCKSA